MMASVSIAARDSLRRSRPLSLRQQPGQIARGAEGPFAADPHQIDAARRVFLLQLRAAPPCTSTPSGSRAASVFSSSGSAEANSIASSSRKLLRRAAARAAFVAAHRRGITHFASLGIATASSIRLPPAGAATPLGSAIPLAAGLTLAHIERRERRLLMHLHHAFAHQFERGGEARREHRRAHATARPRYAIRYSSSRAQSVGCADQPLERLARLGQRPDRALGEPHMRRARAAGAAAHRPRADRRASPSIPDA